MENEELTPQQKTQKMLEALVFCKRHNLMTQEELKIPTRR